MGEATDRCWRAAFPGPLEGGTALLARADGFPDALAAAGLAGAAGGAASRKPVG